MIEHNNSLLVSRQCFSHHRICHALAIQKLSFFYQLNMPNSLNDIGDVAMAVVNMMMYALS